HWNMIGSVGGAFSKDRPLLPHTALVGLELPAGKLVSLALCRSVPGGLADRQRAGFHWRSLSRALEQALALCRAIRTQIGVARFVADRCDHLGAAGSFCRGLCSAALKAAVETELPSRLGEFVAAAAVWHYRVFPA